MQSDLDVPKHNIIKTLLSGKTVVAVNKMFVTVILEYSKKKLAIPFKWVHSLDILQLLNRVHVRSKLYTIYYSNDLTTAPNFRLPISEHFDEAAPVGCYKAQIGFFFGKFFVR